MLLEWLRRRDVALDSVLRRYLFTERPILEVEESPSEPEGNIASTREDSGSLGIGSLSDKELL